MRILKHILIILFATFIVKSDLFAQQLKVIEETSQSINNKTTYKIYREREDGHALLCFVSSIPNLQIISSANDSTWTEEYEGTTRYYFDVDLTEHKIMVDGISFITSAPRYRSIILRSPLSQDYLLKTPELQPTVYYYTILLPDKFPTTMSVEYITSSHRSSRLPTNNSGASWNVRSTIRGIRVAYGGRYGGYCSYKWGPLRPAGQNIDNVTIDCDVSQAQFLGLIRRSIVAGTRIGVYSNKLFPVYIYLGGGYGEYGRLWESPNLIIDNNRFYSDYIKGFNGDVGISIICLDVFSLSLGADMVIGNGKMSVDYQLGLGISLQSKWFKRKIK